MYILRQWKCFFTLHECQPVVEDSQNQNMNLSFPIIEALYEALFLMILETFYTTKNLLCIGSSWNILYIMVLHGNINTSKELFIFKNV